MFLTFVGYIWTLNFYEISFNLSTISNRNLPSVELGWVIGICVLCFSYYYAYRIKLLDRNETVLLHFSILISKLFNIKIFKNFEYSIYRARLSYIELDRLNIDYENLIEVLIAIEDSSFKSHKGINFKSLLRALLSRIPITRKKYNLIKSGGSTLEMQLSRTIFIPTNQNKFKRKFLEFFISRWLNQVLSKEEIIKIYIASVRYGYGLMGLSKALKGYFQYKQLKNHIIDKEHALFLVERLSNISGIVKWERVEYLSNKIRGVDMKKLEKIYDKYKKTTK